MWLKFDFSMLGGLCINLVGELAPAFTDLTKHSQPQNLSRLILNNRAKRLRVCGSMYIIILRVGRGGYYMYKFR